ncbi:tRNA 5-methoxyuridine(34)/uridine 5-oxyacetic acid(34) synthase CmoB, partial [bacterium]|nr:tRNA 5-methoxyuridine(34)/uridine 5-oxyacetic acid(34) synthase CmoB [bacterium]
MLPKTLLKILSGLSENALDPKQSFNNVKFSEVIENLPKIAPSFIDLNSSSIVIGKESDCDFETRQNLEVLMRKLHPWRKGPFTLFGMHIDSEWRSDIKWDRLKNYIKPLKDKLVLDVGCGNGYYCLRMAGQDAKFVIGIDPGLVYVYQFHAINHFIKQNIASVFPLALEDMPDADLFDTVFSMGILYHKKDPMSHLKKLRSQIVYGGELALETLVVDGAKGYVFVPGDRYAKMKNVHNIASCLTVEDWLFKSGFKNIRCINITKTTPEEQRVTNWFGEGSLVDFLD